MKYIIFIPYSLKTKSSVSKMSTKVVLTFSSFLEPSKNAYTKTKVLIKISRYVANVQREPNFVL